MNSNRREFLSLSALAALPHGLLAGASGADESALRFWTSVARRPSAHYARQGEVIEPEQTLECFFHQPRMGFIPAREIRNPAIPSSGGVRVTLQTLRFRPSSASAAAFEHMGSGAIRADLLQTAPSAGWRALRAWSAAVSIEPGSGHGSLAHLDIAGVPLENGLGFWTVNSFVKRNEGLWADALEFSRAVSGVSAPVSPILGLPAILLSSLPQLDSIFGQAQAHGGARWVHNSADTPVYATKQAADRIPRGAGIPLMNGDYLLIPRESRQLCEFAANCADLDLREGCVVAKGTHGAAAGSDSAFIPNVDYLAVRVTVTPALV